MTPPAPDDEQIERLATGVGSLESADSADIDDGELRARLVPIGEGDVTRGGSEKRTYWDAETLQQSVEDGAWDDAKLLKGRPDDGHKSLLDQADPDEIVGSAGSFDYEDGVGPVSEDASVVDEHLAKLVDHGLVDVSPDMLRVLGEYDEELSAYRVEKIIDVPYITILDHGASEGASIEPADEQLGYHALRDPKHVDFLAETLGIDRAELLAGLTGRANDIDDPASDERGEPSTGPDDSETSDYTPNMADPSELQEQLAEVRSERNELESDIDGLEEQLTEKESTIEEYEKQIEQLEQRRDELEEEIDPLVEMLAELAAEDSPLQTEQLAERFEPSELVETLAIDAGWSEDDDEDPVEIVREQLAGSPRPRGESQPEGSPGTGLSDEEEVQAEQLAGEVMTASDTLAAEGSNREYLKQEYDVDPAEYDEVEQLRTAVRGNGGD